MAKQSVYAIKRKKELDESMMTAERITRQFYIDTMQIALARSKLKLGYRRIMELTELCETVRQEYLGAVQRGNEQDVMREHMDLELLQIMAGRFGRHLRRGRCGGEGVFSKVQRAAEGPI